MTERPETLAGVSDVDCTGLQALVTDRPAESDAPQRWALVQCAHVSVRYDDYLGNFYTRLKQRKNHQIAIVATARKMLVSIFYMLKRQEPYDPPEVSA